MNPRIARIDKGRLAIAASLFVVLVLIAVLAHDRLVRPYGGDVLAVVFLYFLLRGATPVARWPAAAAVFAVACAVEVVQALHPGLTGVARTVVGASADPLDIGAYAVGALCAALADRR